MRHRTAFAAVAFAAAAVAGAASAAPTVNIAIGDQLQKKADKYGERELTYLTSDLQRSVRDVAVRQGGGLENAQFNLVIADAKPNRPTFEQLGATPGLSMRSIAIGGATVEGSVTYPDGRVVPVKYSYYNHSLSEAAGSTTWTGATRAFDMFAHRLARGQGVQQN